MVKYSLSLLLACAASAFAADPVQSEGELSGTYAIGGKTLVDPPPGEDPGSRYRVFLTGAAAKDLYDALRVKAEDDECLGDGSQSKRSGGISCTKLADDEGYECSFAVGVDGQSVEPATSC
ncbi:MAG TPA: hypothetical protein VFL14_12470 [Xanthomonadales bacterium]|nr:hypothetical protein [Xanthomonadales bacterium]